MDKPTEQRVTCSCRRTRIRKRTILLCPQCDRAACPHCAHTNVGTRSSCSNCKQPLEGFQ